MDNVMIRMCFFCIVFFASQYATSGILYSKQTHVYDAYVQVFRTKADLSLGDLMVKSALYFKGKPYVASTLDNNGEEKLVVNLQEFDCNTFVETCMALSLTIKSKDYSFSTFLDQLHSIRYRKGILNDYTSRLHYVSDWGYDNTKNGFLIDKSKSLGGFLETKKIDFMSTHPNDYKALKDDKVMQEKIAVIENRMQQRGGFYVIDKSRINEIQDEIKDGDIIAFATSIVGLDYSHIAIAYRNAGQLTFIHASTRTMSVIIEGQSLFDYCRKSTKCTGISVFRTID